MDRSWKKPLRGIITPMVTPLKDNSSLDVDGLERLIEHIMSGGVHGIFILGSTGEAAGLGYGLRCELIERVCRQVSGRVPVLAGITDTAITESLRLAEKAAGCGAYALVAAPPYFFEPGQEELIEYYDHLVRRLPLPLFLYNMPLYTKVCLEPETVKKIAENDGVIGIKDSSGNSEYFQLLVYTMRSKPGFTLLVGPEETTASLIIMGAHGGVNGGSNMFPRLYVRMYEAAAEKDFEKLEPLQDKILHISSSLYRVGRFGSSYLKGVKCVLSLMGICSDFMAEPFHRFRARERDLIAELLEEIDYRELL